MKTYLIADTHFNHQRIATYCDRPANFTELIIANWQRIVTPDDCIIHLGDVAIGKLSILEQQLRLLPGRKILVRGNHDRGKSNVWWMEHGFEFACDALKFRQCWLTHEPSTSLADGCELNVHGHLHNIWHGFNPDTKERQDKLRHPWQRLFAIEYTGYCPIEFEHFISHPGKYQCRGRKEINE